MNDDDAVVRALKALADDAYEGLCRPLAAGRPDGYELPVYEVPGWDRARGGETTPVGCPAAAGNNALRPAQGLQAAGYSRPRSMSMPWRSISEVRCCMTSAPPHASPMAAFRLAASA